MAPGVTDASWAEQFWDRTNKQDWAACESVQRGLASPHYVPGPFAPNEDAVHRWASLIGRAYLGVPPWGSDELDGDAEKPAEVGDFRA